MDTALIPNLKEIEKLARGAGEILKEGFRQDIKISSKDEEIDLVTEMDSRSEAFLLKQIRTRFPDHQIITEESGTHGENGRYAWHVDPLDGTVNYAHGIPIYTVSLGFAVDGRVEKGVVYDPSRDECFSAERGGGAFVNGEAIRVAQADRLAQALMVTGFPYDVWTHPENNLDHYVRFALRTQGVRRLGSAALNLCYVAAGRFDGCWEIRLKSWDIAAGARIAQEAGALVTDIRGGPDYLRPEPSILAANPILHGEMLRLLQDAG